MLHSLPIQNKQVGCTVKKKVLFPLIRRSVTLPPTLRQYQHPPAGTAGGCFYLFAFPLGIS
jgi:hypothetical protein